MADTPQLNSLAAEMEELYILVDIFKERLQVQERINKELTERISRLELYNYRLQSSLVDLSRKE